MSGCGAGDARHWFSFYGWTGFRSPVCVRCGAPNPRPLSEMEWGELIAMRASTAGARPFVWPAARPAFDAAIAARPERGG